MPPVGKPVVLPWLRPVPATDQVKLADEAAFVTAVSDQFRDERRRFGRKRVVAVSRIVNPTRIEPAHETRAARRTDRALAVRMGKRDALADKSINRRRANELVAESSDRVEALLVGAVPQNVWARHLC